MIETFIVVGNYCRMTSHMETTEQHACYTEFSCPTICLCFIIKWQISLWILAHLVYSSDLNIQVLFRGPEVWCSTWGRRSHRWFQREQSEKIMSSAEEYNSEKNQIWQGETKRPNQNSSLRWKVVPLFWLVLTECFEPRIPPPPAQCSYHAQPLILKQTTPQTPLVGLPTIWVSGW